jgi:hypothetical protein
MMKKNILSCFLCFFESRESFSFGFALHVDGKVDESV